MKVFNPNGSVKDIITFSPEGEYVYEQEKSCYDLKGKRGTTLGLSMFVLNSENFVTNVYTFNFISHLQ